MIAKAYEDSKEKDFLNTAVISNLVPNGKAYGILAGQVSNEADEQFKLTKAKCYHPDDGLTCFLVSKTIPSLRATAVFSRLDVSDLYANYIEHRSNKRTIDKIFDQQYKPADLDEDFEEKVGILGSAILYHFHIWPNYSYDDHGGQDLELIYSGGDVSTVIQFSPAELAPMNKNSEPELFYEVEQQIRKKLVDRDIQTSSDEAGDLPN